MGDWLNSPVFFLLVLTLLTAALYRWRRRRQEKAPPESWEAFHAACTTDDGCGSRVKTSKTPDAKYVAALKYPWKPGLKLSSEEKVERVASKQ